MSMNTDGARRWAQLTKQNIGKSIAIVLDGYVYSAPNVNNEITGGNSQITGHFTPEQAKDLANVLRSGKMPAPAHIVQEDIVGPSLGQASINAGIMSFIVALILLMVYMCSMYGFIPGMVANGALVLNLFFTLGILFLFPSSIDDVRYCRYGVGTGYGCRCQRIDLRTYQRRTPCRQGCKESIG